LAPDPTVLHKNHRLPGPPMPISLKSIAVRLPAAFAAA
jgi:hypothetical protein